MPDDLPFSPFEVQDDSNPSGNGLSHLNQAKSGGAATRPGAYKLKNRDGTPIYPNNSWNIDQLCRFYT